MNEIRFAPNQKLPPGYSVVYADELDNRVMWISPNDESEPSWNRWAAYRGAWADYRKKTGGSL